MRAKLLKLSGILADHQVFTLGIVQVPQVLHLESSALPDVILDIFVNDGSVGQLLVQVQI